MTGLKRLTDRSCFGIENYLHPKVKLDQLVIKDHSSQQFSIDAILTQKKFTKKSMETKLNVKNLVLDINEKTFANFICLKP